MMDMTLFIRNFVDEHFAAECAWLAALVRIPTGGRRP